MDIFSTEEIKELIRKDFSIYPEKQIQEFLDICGRKIPDEQHRCKVYWAILQLSGGDIEKLKYFIFEAIKDHKKVFFWAE